MEVDKELRRLHELLSRLFSPFWQGGVAKLFPLVCMKHSWEKEFWVVQVSLLEKVETFFEVEGYFVVE